MLCPVFQFPQLLFVAAFSDRSALLLAVAYLFDSTRGGCEAVGVRRVAVILLMRLTADRRV